jgi:hypothetical protein
MSASSQVPLEAPSGVTVRKEFLNKLITETPQVVSERG